MLYTDEDAWLALEDILPLESQQPSSDLLSEVRHHPSFVHTLIRYQAQLITALS
jgi:hypothetical protein